MRNKLILATMLLCAGMYAHAQNYNPIDIPCKKIDIVDFFQFNGLIESTCIEDKPNNLLPLMTLGYQNIELKASEDITLDNEVWINPNANGDFYAHIAPAEIGLAWYEPLQNPGNVARFTKLEVGIKLPQEILDQIKNYVLEIPNTTQLNPFNPEQVEVKAEFWRNINPAGNGSWIGPLKVFGFYYEEFYENTTNPTPTSWTLNNIATDHNFRIRFAPPQTGIWRCKITTTIYKDTPQEVVYSASEFTFGCISSSNPGYVQVGSNKHFLTLGGQTFFPSGRNIPQPNLITYGAAYQAQLVEDQNGYDNRKIHPSYHMTYRDELTAYKNSGGEYFRTLFFGDWYEIEFEKLNNYYDRLNTAWEFDRLINHCENLDLKMDFCLSNYEYGEVLGDFTQKWDWASPMQLLTDPNNDYDCVSDPTNTNGYCYNTELGVSSPEALLTHSDAIRNYQYRLRYIVSRWGYSTNISIFMLQAEMNNHAKFQNFNPLPDCKHESNVSRAYNLNQNDYLEHVSYWQNEMCKYLKTDQYFPHLTSVNYTGCPRAIGDEENNTTNYAIQNGDNSYYSQYVDVATYDQYEAFWSKFNSMVKNVDDLNDHSDLFSNYAPNINKPIMVAETGDSKAQVCDYGISYIKDTWVSSFTGLAGSAMNWENQHNYYLIQYNQKIKEFFNGINLHSINWTTRYDERNDYKASLYALVSDESQTRAIGIIDNQTVNQFTSGINNCGYTIENIKDQNYQFELPTNVSYGNFGNALSISGMGNRKKYIIEYYNALTMEFISSETKKSQLDGELKLEHPILDDNFTDNSFLIAFKVRRQGQPSFFVPIDSIYMYEGDVLSESTIDSLNPILLTEWENIKSEDSLDFDVNPNPTSSLVKVTFKNQLQENIKINLVDNKGSLIETKDLSGEFVIFDMTYLEKGIYFIILEINSKKTLKKVIKI